MIMIGEALPETSKAWISRNDASDLLMVMFC